MEDLIQRRSRSTSRDQDTESGDEIQTIKPKYKQELMSLREEITEIKNAVQTLINDKKRKSCSPPRDSTNKKLKSSQNHSPSWDDLENFSSHSEGEINDNSEDENLLELESFFEMIDKKGGRIDTKLATIIDNGLCKQLSEEKIKEIGDKYLPPENTNNIRVPRTNQEIWKLLSKTQKGRDIKLQKTQNIITKTITASVGMLDKLRKARKEKQEVNLKDFENTMTDIIRLSSACFTDVSYTRKESMKSGLIEKFRPLCTKNDTETNSTEFLFGDNLNQKIKDLGESSKLSNTLGTPFQRHSKNSPRGRPYGYQKFGRNNYTGDDPRKPFQKRNQKNYTQTSLSYKRNY